MNLTVLGAGAWGTALAVQASGQHATRLWARDASQAAQMRSLRRNRRYLGDVALPPALQVSADFNAALAHAEGGLVVVATPMAALDEMLRRLGSGSTGVIWLCKGFQQGTGWLGHEVARAACPGRSVGVLSGPSFADEVAAGRPTALVAASTDAALCQRAVDAFHGESLRVYTSDDPVGVEVGGAVKNVLAIATGIADGMALGLNARAALVTRGLAEMTRLGVALGARAPKPSPACRAWATSCSPPPATCRATAASASRSPKAGRSPTSLPTSATSPKACTARRWCCAAPTRAASRCRSPRRWRACSTARCARSRRSSS